MRFEQYELPGVWKIVDEPVVDQRGSFTRTWCDREFAAAGLETNLSQLNIAYSHAAGTLRGLHFQANPHWETKLIRCVAGSAWVAIVDLRRDSPTHQRWLGIQVDARSPFSIYVSPGFAQGYQTLADETRLQYAMSEHYSPKHARGYRYDDQAFGIVWPRTITAISERDLTWEAYQ